MTTDVRDYAEVSRLLLWLDIDPTFDSSWLSWVFKRPYVFCPSMNAAVGEIGGLDFSRAIVDSEELGKELISSVMFKGKGIDERLTAEQIRYAAGLKKENGKLRPVRLDKAILTAYAINKSLSFSKKTTGMYKIYISAYNINGLSKIFVNSDAEKKSKLKAIITEGTTQNKSFVGDFLKGNKASLDFTIRAYEILYQDKDIRESLPDSLEEAIETPTQRYTTAALGEDFSKTRLSALPLPFRRPI